MSRQNVAARRIGLLSATGVGVGAIVGGGILALAGVAFAKTGPSAILAFGANGLIALLTVLSFAELSSAFPQSGGTYTFAKKVLSVEAAFMVGWIVWFASIVAAVLYAVGFGYFGAEVLRQLFGDGQLEASWLGSHRLPTVLATAAAAFYVLTLSVSQRTSSGWTNVGKLVVFGVLIVAGLFKVPQNLAARSMEDFQPFFAGGAMGFVQAMGFSFIALQGFDLIAAVAGEIKEPSRVIPRAMMWSLSLALVIYLPLLAVIATAGVPAGESITTLSAANVETVVAVAARNYLGSFGYWLVLVAATLSMLSALQANVFAASRVSYAMAQDRTLPRLLARCDRRRRIPVVSVVSTGAIALVLIVVVPDLAAAGAASSLIFLVTFALAHVIAIKARRRASDQLRGFRTPLFPAVPVLGGLTCFALAAFQGATVPAAGYIMVSWLGFGAILFIVIFARQARVVDAATEALDPTVARLRGRNPLVLVPIANPDSAASMVALANALAPPAVGRVLLLNVVRAPSDDDVTPNDGRLMMAQQVLGEALNASLAAGLCPETLTTIGTGPWQEISRVATLHRCESLLVGLSDLSRAATPLETLIETVESDVVVLRAEKGWSLSAVREVLVPLSGRGVHDTLRARFLGSLTRVSHSSSRDISKRTALPALVGVSTGATTAERSVDRQASGMAAIPSSEPVQVADAPCAEMRVRYVRILPERATAREMKRARQELSTISRDEVGESAVIEVLRSDSPSELLMAQATAADLVVLGLHRASRRRGFGTFTLEFARRTTCPLVMIGRA